MNLDQFNKHIEAKEIISDYERKIRDAMDMLIKNMNWDTTRPQKIPYGEVKYYGKKIAELADEFGSKLLELESRGN